MLGSQVEQVAWNQQAAPQSTCWAGSREGKGSVSVSGATALRPPASWGDLSQLCPTPCSPRWPPVRRFQFSLPIPQQWLRELSNLLKVTQQGLLSPSPAQPLSDGRSRLQPSGPAHQSPEGPGLLP